ncbi:hypothetical protein Ae201684P_022380 [Aphanomyces euteiches]|nr:hypothetical protein Ae201684P_022380 [Aphanomyces euteiches]KAH9151284.1 hypothetical protein AeRB84_006069 [Aphanomyces euteiches]
MRRTLCVLGNEHCVDLTSAFTSSAVMYFIALGYTVMMSIHRSRNLREHGHATHFQPARRIQWFPTLLTGAFACRSAWCVLVGVHAFENLSVNGTYVHTYVHNSVLNMDLNLFPLGVALWEHLATLLYVSAFTTLLQFWDDMCDITSSSVQNVRWQHSHASRSSYIVIINVWMYLAEFTLLTTETLWTTRNLLHDIRDVVESLFFFALACLLIRGAYRLRSDLLAFDISPLAQRLGHRVWFLGWFSSGWFLLKSWTGLCTVAYPQRAIHPWLRYTIPEIVPALVVLMTMRVQPPTTPQQTTHLHEEKAPLLPVQLKSPPFTMFSL